MRVRETRLERSLGVASLGFKTGLGYPAVDSIRARLDRRAETVDRHQCNE
jgi:hypothetical protein